MALRSWSWGALAGPAGVGDRPLLEALAAAIPDEAVDAAIEATGTREQRRRLLPTHLVVTLVVAMGLWASASMRHVLAEVVAGWREGAGPRSAWQLPSPSAIVQARQRSGARLFRELFQAVAGPLATPTTPGAFLNGLRLMAVDGTLLDLADTSANERAFGRLTTSRGQGSAPFPQLRLVALIETGTHALCDVVLRPCRRGEQPAALRVLRSVGPGMLVLWDRGFHSYEMVRRTCALGAEFLGRTRSDVVLPPTEVLTDGSFLSRIYPSAKARRHNCGLAVRVVEYTLGTPAGSGREVYRLITSLLDEHAFPAALLAATYHERWEIETVMDELKVHQWAHPKPLRSQHPREVVQEVYGLLLAHLAIRTLMHQAAVEHGLDPDRLSFTGALQVLRRAIPQAQRTCPSQLVALGRCVLRDLAAERLPPRRPRQNPRAVKRKMTNYPLKPPRSTSTAGQFSSPSIHILWP